uniref:Uncharacterized protein K02A2.6-like n=1 Tax=Saccoglossus kowalevskii TaxID=10224 RepID=A0ABM0MVQ3_SACKO|nr:PREDICTED: uncharacterized protein K02A2.6-like [Saccoglossus kowalevskii]
MKTVTSEKIIERIDSHFSSHGYPIGLKSDNGPQFISEEFENYLEECGIRHKHTTPLWPQANREVERQNRSLLKVLKIAQLQKRKLHKELNKFLLAYRSTPHTTTGMSPAEAMFKRKLRTKLPETGENRLREDDRMIRDRDTELKQKSKD